jgi:ABC-type uncharacterized transport system involved in gliding motility auxiliary subunit
MEMTAHSPNQRPAMGLVLVAAIALLAVGCAMTVDGFFPPAIGLRWARWIFMTVEIIVGLYIVAVSVGLAARFEWARLSAIWIGALFSPFYVIRLLAMSEVLVAKTRDFKFAETVPNFFLLCLASVAVSTLVVTTLTSRRGRAVFAHVTDSERTDWLGLTCLNVCIALSLLVMVNYAASRYYTRWDVTRSAFYNLSDKTKTYLGSVRDEVEVIVYYQGLTPMSEYIENLLSEFRRFCPTLRVEYVDPIRHPIRSEQVRQQFGLTSPDTVVFAVGSGDSRRIKHVAKSEMADFEPFEETFFEEGGSRLIAFKAEEAFLSALQNVLQDKQPKVYFLTGNGERDPDEIDEYVGYADAAALLRKDNIVVSKLNLTLATEVPADCDLLIVAGPTSPLPAAAQQALKKYLDAGGRLFAMLDADTDHGLSSLLADYNVKVSNDVIFARHLRLLSGGHLFEGTMPFAAVQTYSDHPIVAKLTKTTTLFPFCRSVSALEPANTAASTKYRVSELARVPAAPAYWGEMNHASEGRHVRYTPGVDLAGPLAVAVAVESVPQPEAPQSGSTRLVVVGSSSYLLPPHLSQGNANFFLNAVNWLLRRHALVGILPKTPQQYAVRMSPEEARWTKIVVIAGIPGLIALLGLVTWIVRRK